MSLPDDGPDRLLSNDQLPPVEPPSAGFILQLFVIPALIVVIIFVVGAGIKWLVERDQDPAAYVRALERDNDGRWQAAHDLADLLRNPQRADLKQSADLAGKLADILNRELDAAEMDDQAIQLRIYLCHALGEFQTPVVIEPLLRAATTERADAEKVVRFSAFKALAVFLSAAPPGTVKEHARLMPALLAASREDSPLLRSTAAFGLAAADTPQARKRLQTMLVDGTPDVRYNAATMLARLGDAKSVSVLAEMLDPNQVQATDDEERAADSSQKRDLIVVNALRATRDLAQKNPQADLSPIVASLSRAPAQQDGRTELPTGIQLQADELLAELKKRKN